MNSLVRLIYRKREFTAKKAKIRLNLRVSTKTVRKYLNLLGWRRVCTRFCQLVSFKNKIERVIYSKLCKITNERFDFSFFIDEYTISIDKNSKFQFYEKCFSDESRSGLKPKYKHMASIHVMGGISRRRAT